MVRRFLGTLFFLVTCASCGRPTEKVTPDVRVEFERLGASDDEDWDDEDEAADVRVEFERLAAKLPYLTVNGVLYDRPDGFHSARRFADPSICEEHNRILASVTSETHSQDSLVELLSHSDAKVRTLAAVALFDREDPFVLPLLVKLCADQAATFDERPELALEPANGPFWGSAPPPLKQSVADIAGKMVEFYTKRAGFHYAISHHSQPGFAEYWNERRSRSHCASWFAVQLARASQGISPTPDESLERIRAVRRRIDALPPADRAWVLLRLNGEDGGSALVTEIELREACEQVGPSALMLLLQNQVPSDDPDLQPRPSNNWPYRRMTLFVLRHAAELLRPEDSDALLACERWQRDYQKHGISDPTITAWWGVAAARLKPDRASEILHAAYERFQGKYDSVQRAILCVAMWELAGNAKTQFIVDWFYTDTPEHSSFPHSRGEFIEAMGRSPKGRTMIATLVRDPRCDEIDWQSLERIVRVVNRWSVVPIVTEEELDKAWHPLGIGSFDGARQEARQKYPAETADLEAHLAEWVKRLRQGISQWEGESRL